VTVLEGSSPTLQPTRLIFDSQSGLLVRVGGNEYTDYGQCGVSSALSQSFPPETVELPSRKSATMNPSPWEFSIRIRSVLCGKPHVLIWRHLAFSAVVSRGC